MKRLLMTALLASAMPMVFAQTAPAAPDMAPSAQSSDAKQPRLSERYCLRETGSRVVRRQGAKAEKPCNGLPGRTYTRADLDSTGQATIADALRMLDPTVY